MQLLSIGTLVAYTKVSISVLVSRFQSGVQSVPENDEGNTNITQWLHKMFSKAKGKQSDPSSIAYQRVPDEEDTSSLPAAPGAEVTEATTFRAELAVFFLVIFLAALALILSNFYHDVFIKGEWWATSLCFQEQLSFNFLLSSFNQGTVRRFRLWFLVFLIFQH